MSKQLSPPTLPVNKIQRNPHQPRKVFDPDELQSLASSMRTLIDSGGVISALVVKPLGEGLYELIAGERRWRAAQLADMSEVPAIIRDVDAETAAIMALVDNIFSKELNLREEANYFAYLSNEFGWSWAEIGRKMGLPEGSNYVRRRARINSLPEEVQAMVGEKKITLGQAEELLKLKSEGQIIDMAIMAVEAQWNRDRLSEQIELVLNGPAKIGGEQHSPASSVSGGAGKFIDTDIGRLLVERVREDIGLGFQLKETKGKIKLTFECTSPEEVTSLLVDRLKVDLAV